MNEENYEHLIEATTKWDICRKWVVNFPFHFNDLTDEEKRIIMEQKKLDENKYH